MPMPVNGGRFKNTFSTDQLDSLKKYVCDIERRAFGLTIVQLQKLVYNFAETNNIDHRFNNKLKMAGKDWCYKFMQESGFSFRKPEATSIGRLMCFNKTNVEKFFETLKDIRTHKHYQAHQIFNVDESGLSTVPTKKPKVISPVGVKRVAKVVSAERGKSITVVCAINASGSYIPPFFIFPRKRLRPDLMLMCPPGSHGIAHESGWMTNDNFLIYLEHFKKYAKPSNDNPILLILDNHASHVSLAAISFCRNNHITMLGFPPHTTHRLQPLDVSFFGPLKTFYSQSCDNYMINNPGCVISEATIGKLFSEAYVRAATLGNAINGFKACGIEPFNANIFPDEEFAAAATTDKPNSEETTTTNEFANVLENTLTQNEQMESNILIINQDDLSANDGNNIVVSENIEPNICQPTTFKLPELPVAPIKVSKRVRSKLPSMVLTSSPVKLHLEQKKKLKEDLIQSKILKKEVRITKQKIKQEKALIKKKNMVKKKLFKDKYATRKNFSKSSSDEEEPQYIITDDEDSAEEECMYCTEPYKNDKNGEKWIRCMKCERWGHEICAGVDDYKSFTCEFCK